MLGQREEGIWVVRRVRIDRWTELMCASTSTPTLTPTSSSGTRWARGCEHRGWRAEAIRGERRRQRPCCLGRGDEGDHVAVGFSHLEFALEAIRYDTVGRVSWFAAFWYGRLRTGTRVRVCAMGVLAQCDEQCARAYVCTVYIL